LQIGSETQPIVKHSRKHFVTVAFGRFRRGEALQLLG